MFSINVHLEYANNRALMICIVIVNNPLLEIVVEGGYYLYSTILSIFPRQLFKL